MQEVEVVEGIEGAGLLRAERDEPAQLATDAQRQHQLRAESLQHRPALQLCSAEVRVVGELVHADGTRGALQARDEGMLGGDRHRRLARQGATVREREAAVARTQPHRGAVDQQRLANRLEGESVDLVHVERRDERTARALERLLRVVARPVVQPIDDALHRLAQRRQEHDDEQAEDECECRGVRHVRALEDHPQAEHDDGVRDHDDAAQQQVVDGAAEHGVDLEQIELHDGVREAQREEKRGEGGHIERLLAAGEAGHRCQPCRDREAAHDAEQHDPETLAYEEGRARSVRVDARHDQARARESERRHAEVVHA